VWTSEIRTPKSSFFDVSRRRKSDSNVPQGGGGGGGFSLLKTNPTGGKFTIPGGIIFFCRKSSRGGEPNFHATSPERNGGRGVWRKKHRSAACFLGVISYLAFHFVQNTTQVCSVNANLVFSTSVKITAGIVYTGRIQQFIFQLPLHKPFLVFFLSDGIDEERKMPLFWWKSSCQMQRTWSRWWNQRNVLLHTNS